MNRTKQNILLFILILFSAYCAITIGESWDHGTEVKKGKVTIDYLFSLGKIDNYYTLREIYSPIYWSLLYIVSEIFPSQYENEVIRLTNLIVSLSTIFGVGKIGKELFNEKVGKITFLIFFLYPIFFGHMAINSKDTIIAFCHVWIFYLLLKYLQKQNITKKKNKYIFCIALLTAIATGQQLLFIGSLGVIILFVLIEIFQIKKIITNLFSVKIFIFDMLKCFIIFYLILILFWIDVHGNILIHPFNNIMLMFSENFWTGWSYNLVNGQYYASNDLPAYYFLINFFYKSPEYILISYIIFLVLILNSKNFYNDKFKFFNHKLFLIISILVFPNLILLFLPFPIYDGMRLFLWTLPYFFIIPALTIYYLIENFNYVKPKLTLLLLSLFIIYYLFNFLSITPYQYTYLNSFNGKIENRYKKFENDYWGTSIKELVKNATFGTNDVIKISTCGINHKRSKKYFIKRGDLNFRYVRPENADYIIMTNRTLNNKGLTNCFDLYQGKDISSVKRNGLILSLIRKIKM